MTTIRSVKVLQVCAIDATAWLLLRNQMLAMRDRGWTVGIACSEGAYFPRLQAEGITTHAVPIGRDTNAIAHLKAAWALAGVIKAGGYHVVHVHTPVASLVGRLAAKLAGVPLTFYTAHGFYFHDEMPAAQRRRHVWLERAFGRLTDHLFTQSAEDAATAVKEGIMPEGAVTAIGNGVLLERFRGADPAALADWRARLGIPEGLRLVGMVGRVVEEKGYREYFEAARQLVAKRDDVGFLVVGSALAGDRDTFQAEIAQLLEAEPALKARVFFTGFTEDIPTLMNLMDVFTLPSYREGMPRSIIEAMAAGKPVVATNIRGSREEVVEGETGFLIPLKDAGALADRLERLLADPALARAQGQAGRERAEAMFHESMVIDRLLKTFDQLLERRGAR